MTTSNYDLIILGGGAAAFAAATEADRQNLRTIIINAGLPLGGTCVNVGCVPSKHLLALGKNLHHPAHPDFPSVEAVTPSFDFPRAMADKDALVNALRQQNYQDVLDSFQQVEYLEGRGKLIDAHMVEAARKKLTGDKILIATGSSTKIPPFKGLEETGYLTHIEALELQRLPASLVIFGAGFLALEFAQIFNRMGTRVTLVARAPRILRIQEPEISVALRGYFEAEGIEIVTEAGVQEICKGQNGKQVALTTPSGERRLETEEILVATGVRGNIDGLGLGQVGVATEHGERIAVNEHLQTSVPHIYAAGDVTGRIQLETVAAKEGKIAVENAFADAGKVLDFQSIPYAVFTDPEVASVGMTEAEYVAIYGTCSCRTVSLDRVPRAVAVRDTRGLLKMVAHHETGQVMGVHLLAPNASEMIHEAVLAVKHGLSVDDLIDTVHVFPTYSEAIKIAAQAFRRNISTMSCCVE
ncbi:mercury(II) reductase [Paucidesulfovibrio longus]|uniref:mercury(II) reductase n=1 Tax=Paucidesulfovibrio longus TaxID=889 RepID=UPI0003B32E4F|nr:mercury(II) reductase [Paucidesulfovibrio longus]